MAIGGLGLSALGSSLANLPEDMAGLQLEQSKAQLGQQQVAAGQRQMAEMQGLQRASQEAMNPATGQLDQNKFIGLVGQYAPSHLPAVMQAGGMYAYRQAQAGNQNSLTDLHGAQTDLTGAKEEGLQLKKQVDLNKMISQVAQGAQEIKDPAALDAYLAQNKPRMIQAGLSEDDFKNINVHDPATLQAYASQGLNGHDFAQFRQQAQSQMGKLDQDVAAGRVSQDWADRMKKKWTDIYHGMSMGQGGDIQLTPEAKDAMAEYVHIQGPEALKGMGQRFNAQHGVELLNRERELHPGASWDPIANNADIKATTSSLQATQKQRDAVHAFSTFAHGNGEAALELLKKAPDTGVPIMNRKIRDIQTQLAGDPTTASLAAQLDIYLKDVGRITTNPNLTGPLTVSEKKDMQELQHPGGITLGMFEGLMKVYKGDMDRRESTLNDLLKEQRGRIPAVVQGSGPSKPTGKVVSLEDYLKQ